MSLSSISIIIPTLNEAEALPATLAASRSALPEAEVIVADGGSTYATVKIALAHRAQVVFGPRGRGPQCRSGAAAARGDLLLFLHADTLLPPDAGRVLAEAFARSEMQIGTFRLSFDRPGPFLAACSWFTRFDSVFTRFGDQGITVRRAFHDELDGFAPWPLFEDVDFLRRARSRTRVWSFPAEVRTSARRFRQHGPLRQQLRNAVLLLRFLTGTKPESLAASYKPEPTHAS